MRYPASLPAGHRAFLDRALAHWRTDPRILGAAIGGSFQRDTMDLFSDLDFTLVVAPAAHAAIMAARADYAAQLGPLLAAFTGEHVGEPRLLICLYADPLLHVDLKFVSAAEHAGWVPDHLVLAKPGLPVLSHSESAAAPDRAWIARRIWIWVHYAAAKIGRGELFEALDFLASLRGTVLGPLCLHAAGQPPYGVRRLEEHAPAALLAQFRATVASYDARDLLRATRAAVRLYLDLSGASADDAAAQAVLAYLDDVEAGLAAAGTTPPTGGAG